MHNVMKKIMELQTCGKRKRSSLWKTNFKLSKLFLFLLFYDCFLYIVVPKLSRRFPLKKRCYSDKV